MPSFHNSHIKEWLTGYVCFCKFDFTIKHENALEVCTQLLNLTISINLPKNKSWYNEPYETLLKQEKSFETP